MKKRGKIKISKVKRNNQTTNKMRKQGKSKLHRNSGKMQKQTTNGDRHTSGSGAAAPSPSPSDDDRSEEDSRADMLDEDDARDLLHRLRRQPALLATLPEDQLSSKQRKRRRRRSDSGAESADSDIETAYARELAQHPAKRVRPLLPIKTNDGLQLRHESDDDNDVDEELGTSGDDERDSGVEGAPVDAHSDDENIGSTAPLTAVQLLAKRRELLRRERLRIGALCSALLENPEKRLKNLWAVVRLMDERTSDGSAQLTSVRQLAALSVLEVFRDLLPEYTIRHQDYSGVKLKKETLALYKYEKELLEVYRRYLQRLERGANTLRGRGHGHGDHRLALVHVRCLCELLAARPYFNFAANIVATVVPLLQAHSEAVRRLVGERCARVLADDVRGDISVAVVRRVARLARARGDRLRPEALRCLLELRADDALDDEDELRRRRIRDEKRKKRIVNLSKNEKKRAKKLREVERELQETTARENEAARRRHLTEATRSLFHVYFGVLKGAPQPALSAAALEGVAKFAHLINVDYYSDLLSALTALGARSTSAEALRVARAGLAVLAGRGEALAADPTPFLDLLFRALGTLHHRTESDDVRVAVECVQAASDRARRLPGALPAALAKRVASAGLQVAAGGALAALALVRRLTAVAPAARTLLEAEVAPAPDDAPGPRRYDPFAASAAQCGARAAALYELVPLRRHYHPHVRAAALAADAPSAPPPLLKLSAVQILERYEGAALAFVPAVQTAPPPGPRAHHPHAWAQEDLRDHCAAVEAAVFVATDFSSLFDTASRI